MKVIEKYFKISCIFTVVIILLTVLHNNPLSTRNDLSQNYERFENNWQRNGEAVEFPYMMERDGDQAILTNKLPEVHDTDKLILKASFRGVRVFINQELIYEYLPITTTITRMRGDLYLYVPLNKDYSNQSISIELIGGEALPGGLSSITLGDEASFMVSLMEGNQFNQILLLLMFMFGIALLAVAAYIDIRKKRYDYRIFLYLGVFTLISAIWLWTDSPSFHINESDAVSISLLSFISFMAIPLPVIAFVNCICTKSKQFLNAISLALFGNIMLQTCLFVMGYSDFIKLLPITHGLLILSIVLMISALIKEIKSNNSMMAKGFLLALSILGFFSLITLIEFYTKPLTSDRIWFMLGFIAFIVILVYFCVKRVWQLYEQNTKLKFYHDMAYADMMTLAQNRTAFNEMMGQLRGTDLTDVTLLILDINNLKQVNDQYGHQRGDQMIIDTSTCILSVFKNNVYRIGGDEFAVLILDDDVMVQDYLKRLDDTLSNYNASNQYPISLAYGYAKGNAEMDIEALFKQADENMYAKKFKQKSEL